MRKLLWSTSQAVLATVACTGTAMAQTAQPPAEQEESREAQPAEAEARNGSVIVVTALKRTENLSDVPMSITAISGDDLAAKGVVDVEGLVKVTPGLSYADSGLGTPVFSLRGVGFFETSLGARPTVSVYVDEAPLPFSVMAKGASFDLERVEVLKGPQGTLFGTNSTGGAINYIAAKPEDEWGAGGLISFARFSTVDYQGHVTGPISSNMRMRLAGRVVQGDGWQESYTRDDDHGSQDFAQGRFLLDWDVSDKFKVSANLNGFVDRGETQASQLIGLLYVTGRLANEVPLLGAYPLAPEDNRAADWDATTDYRRNTRFYQGVLRGDYELNSDITLTSLSAWSRILVNQNNDVDGTALPHSDISIVGKVASFSTELRLAGETDKLRWIVGGSYARESSLENDYIHFPYASANHAFTPAFEYDETNPYTTQDFVTKAIFGNVDIDLGDFTFHAGARYTDADLDYTGCTKVNSDSSGSAITSLFNILRAGQGLAPIPDLKKGDCQSLDATLTPNLRDESFDQENVSWRVGVDFKPTDDLLLYANVSRGYKAGSVPAPGAINLEEFDPVSQESVLAYEAGFKAEIVDRVANITGAAFYYDYTDKQLLARRITTPNLLGALPALINIPKSEVLGAEAQINIYPVDGLSLTAAATYLDTKVTEDFVNFTILATQENFKGNPFPYTPKWQVVLDGQYKFPVSAGIDAMIGGNMNYRTATTAGFGTNAFLDIDDYAIVDVRAGVEDPDGVWSVQIFGRNITDTYYWTNVAKFNDTVRRLTGTPATYGIQVGFNF